MLLLSDGRFDRENKERLRNLVREMNERGQLLVLIGELTLSGRNDSFDKKVRFAVMHVKDFEVCTVSRTFMA